MSVIIETERLIIREFNIDDQDAVFAFGSNEIVNKYTGDTLLTHRSEALNIINDVWLEEYKRIGYARWAVVYKADSRLIGFAGLKYLPEFKATDIGYRFLPEYWGNGIATEASEAIIKYGFHTLKLDRIIGIADPDNIGSCRVLEKIGFKLFKVDEYDGDGKRYNWYELKR